ncbi:FRG domain-containing protein [uncultured Halovibrio sp.]|uniref:FRG domain-containing protein n=1 Tax=uncultured Halovibrio sp. TaxID=985049 RepID=UPI00260046BF|nr:FRG domain-containing protein [uncultured Halovibrio sp.]
MSKFREGRAKVWLRGVSNSSHTQVPSLLRKEVQGRTELGELEKQMITRFKDRSLPYIGTRPFDDWGWLFLMQHYGVPTRLLDWSENPFVALFFAVKYAEKYQNGNYKKDAVVWMVDPDEWNNQALEFQGYKGGILNVDDDQLRPFKPPADFSSIPQYCLAIYGAYNSSRIVAQRGSFFIFGAPDYSMEKIYQMSKISGCFEKVLIKKSVIGDICKELLDSGITESVIFPDLEGLAQEIKRDFGFEG